MHLLCDRDGGPLYVHLSPGQAHEASSLERVLQGADAHLRDANGNPVPWPAALAGDKAYRATWVDTYLLDLGITPIIPSKANEDRNARPVLFDKDAYRDRNIVERLIGWLKESRRVFSRFEKTAKNYLGMLKLAFIRRFLRLAYGGL